MQKTERFAYAKLAVLALLITAGFGALLHFCLKASSEARGQNTSASAANISSGTNGPTQRPAVEISGGGKTLKVYSIYAPILLVMTVIVIVAAYILAKNLKL
jgi:hypothetical protein